MDVPCFASFNCILPGFFILLSAVAIWYGVRATKQYNAMLGSLAAELGCQVEEGGTWAPAQIRGEYRGREIRAYTVTEGSGKHRTTYQIVSAGHKGRVEDSITLTFEGFGTRLAKAFGSQDLQTGNPGFDEKYMIQSKWPGAAQALNFEVQEKITVSKLPLSITPKTVSTKVLGRVSDKEQLKRLIDQVVDIAESVDRV
jgi:hypothetical protein